MTSLDEDLAAALLAHDATVATAESCTAGLVAGRIADRPGSSAYLIGGFVTYANRAKTEEVGVAADVLDRVGAVSEEVAVAMAQGARARLGTTYGLSTTGVAGPDGGTPQKPVGRVHIAVVSADRTWHRRLQLDGDRAQVRADTVTEVLRLLLEAVATG
ncbi:CinA family protein [Cumulibacter manganitolerans]|uniref:CinA family protein n=1 Tax=Cumulibacter manganitolerans TaxID=1884992 RepID=UPI001E3EA869|nr:nicotinamide-nucleotide amidohydrolase family protein [Cumulibacter manganitolerans]